MAARVMRRMSLGKASILVFILVALLTTGFMIKMSQGAAAPTDPQDSTQVPHYFGPWTNWALSPLTLPDATVAITGDGTGAEATATVGANGAITGITVTKPGNGYTTATVVINGAGTGAAATATLTGSGAVTAITVDPGKNGAGYKSPVVTISGGGATTDATATAYGGVDSITLQNAGTGYQFPTVDFDMPDDPNGVKAQADATIDANGVDHRHHHHQPRLGLRHRAERRDPRRHTDGPGGQRRRRRLRGRDHQRHEHRARHLRRRIHPAFRRSRSPTRSAAAPARPPQPLSATAWSARSP